MENDMKKNQGITLITLVITIIVIILLASITIYSGINAVTSVRKKSALDNTNAIFQSLSAHEDSIPSDNVLGKMLSECDSTSNEELSNDDFKLLGLNFTTEDCKVVFSKSLEGENLVKYVFNYTDNYGDTYENIEYSFYKPLDITTNVAEFDNVKKVNRPVISDDSMIALNNSDEKVNNLYFENWYQYEKGVSKLAMMEYDGNVYAWIPRFAYKIQSFYVGKDYENIPSTAIDIVFLRDDTDYMANGEVLGAGYTIHPAFENGETGFWIMTEPYSSSSSSISSASSSASRVANGHLMKNSEYAATIFLLKFLENTDVSFEEREFVAAGCDISEDNFDIYSSNSSDANYIGDIKGQALTDTPWNLTKTPTLPDSTDQYLLRHVSEGGEFYYESTAGSISAVYRTVISK